MAPTLPIQDKHLPARAFSALVSPGLWRQSQVGSISKESQVGSGDRCFSLAETFSWKPLTYLVTNSCLSKIKGSFWIANRCEKLGKESLTQTVAATLDYLGWCSKNKLQGALNLQGHAPRTYTWSPSQKWTALEPHHKHKQYSFKANWRGPKQMSSQAWAFWSCRKCWRLKSKPGLTRNLRHYSMERAWEEKETASWCGLEASLWPFQSVPTTQGSSRLSSLYFHFKDSFLSGGDAVRSKSMGP